MPIQWSEGCLIWCKPEQARRAGRRIEFDSPLGGLYLKLCVLSMLTTLYGLIGIRVTKLDWQTSICEFDFHCVLNLLTLSHDDVSKVKLSPFSRG